MWNFALYSYQTTSSGGGVNAPLIAIYVLWILAVLAALWKLFVKTGRPGWKGIIPIYNYVEMFRMVGMSAWYTVLLFVPLVNIVMGIILYNKVSKAFGHGVGMTILIFLGGIGILILGFGGSKYHGAPKPAVTN